MITTEKAFDMLPHMVEIFDKLELQKYGKEKAQEYKKKNPNKSAEEMQNELGTEIVKYILKNSAKIKEEFFNIAATALDVDVKEAKGKPLLETMQVVKDIFLNENLMAFFKSAMQ